MPLVFAGVIPHSPILHSAIGRKAVQEIPDTLQAFEYLRNELYIHKVDTLFVLTDHGHQTRKNFEIMGSETIKVDLSLFGDLVSKLEVTNDLEMVTRLKDMCDSEDVPLKIDSSFVCDYGAGIPLFDLHAEVNRVVIIRCNDLSTDTHIHLGRILKDLCGSSSRRFGLLVTGDLSHTLSSESPGGFHSKGALFDDQFRDIMASGNITHVSSIDSEVVVSAHACVYRPMIILVGVIGRMHYTIHELAYESPFGVGFGAYFIDLNS